ncbi:fenitrothion hydrolase [Patulibacter sp.]|uniref:fenitrothion hydrolase n=1 Tax=Patulibacter sp. TaxID=1912859 RepID=UPI002717FDFA|nr:fenitrothion hydrolase [Patulibacter sp.]MDO9407548.1 fenitrothion hydrolase [Patulibacter sp.]
MHDARPGRSRRALAAGISVAAAALLLPSPAAAHGLGGTRTLPIPEWLFAWAAAIVLVVSFVGLSILWPRPRLAQLAEGRSWAVPAPVRHGGRVVLGLLGVALWVLTVWAGLTGTENIQANLAPTMVYVAFWVGLPVLSLFVGDLWRALSPWRAIADAAGWIGRRVGGEDALPAPMTWPARVGLWPAAAVLLAFAWLELAAPDKDAPDLLGLLALLYGAAMLIGSGIWGTRFLDHADGFDRYFRLAASLSPLRWADGRLHVRWPGTGLAGVRPEPGLAAVVLVLVGSTTFDGLSGGELWTANGAPGVWLTDRFSDLGLGASGAATAAATVGLAVTLGLVSGFVRLGIAGVRSVDPTRLRSRELMGRFAPTIVPIAVGYAVAHYISLLAQRGQTLGFLLSDPRGTGSDWFGTAGWGVDYGLLSGNSVWYVQVVALVLGHVAGLVAAHDLALRTFRGPRSAARSQYWMLAVMVAFTSLGLWLLS